MTIYPHLPTYKDYRLPSAIRLTSALTNRLLADNLTECAPFDLLSLGITATKTGLSQEATWERVCALLTYRLVHALWVF